MSTEGLTVELPIQTFYSNIVLGLLRIVCMKNRTEGLNISNTLKRQMPIIYRTHFEREISHLDLNDDDLVKYNAEFERALGVVMSDINAILDDITKDNRISADNDEE